VRLTRRERLVVALGAALLLLGLGIAFLILPLTQDVGRLQKRLPLERQAYERAVQLRERILALQPRSSGSSQPAIERVRRLAAEQGMGDRLSLLRPVDGGAELTLSGIGWQPLVSLLAKLEGGLEQGSAPLRATELKIRRAPSGLVDASMRLAPAK
jgi:type II secretory pathway component PulM